MKLIFLGLTILEVLVKGSWRTHGQQEERKGDPVCWAQMPTEVRGAWSGLVWKLQKRSWGDVQRWDSEVPAAICLLESCYRGRWGWRGRPPGSGLPQ